ncbi:hypothetical protein [Thalassotalea marina]|uniref:hypothetical protein n=1 Tax=Thalassotalea marina TaxID=1673741 RepID=UPI0016769903|nr:hypothetical protein [Thalassotalea marina]
MWSRKGWLAPVVIIGTMALVQASFNFVYGKDFYIQNEWPKMLAALVGSASVGMLGYYLNYKTREVLHENTRLEKKAELHKFIGIPIEYWAIIFPAMIAFSILK